MNQHRFNMLTRATSGVASRRAVVSGLVGAGLGLGAARLPNAEAAKRKRKRRKKRKPALRCDVCRRGCRFASVQAAVDAAAPGDTIRLCPETYAEHLYVEKNLTLVGAGAGRSFLDGGGGASAQSVLGVGPAVTVAVSALTVRGGNRGVGGGIFNEGTLTLTGVNVTGNTGNDAAGIYNNPGATLQLVDSRVSGNEAGSGGGIYVDGGAVTLTRSRVTGNKALDGGLGGGIYVNDGVVALNESQVTGNEAVGTASKGGGFYIFIGAVTLNASQVTGNSAASGGGIYKSGDASVTIAPGSVTGNTPNNCAGNAVGNCVN